MAGMAWLIWAFAKIPQWLHAALLVFVLASVATTGGVLLHAIFYSPTPKATCTNNAQAEAKFDDAARAMNDSFCQPVPPLPPPHSGPLHLSWGHLPYINSRQYLQQLTKYVCSPLYQM